MLRLRIFVNGKARWCHNIARLRLASAVELISEKLSAAPSFDEYVVVADDGILFTIVWRHPGS